MCWGRNPPVYCIIMEEQDYTAQELIEYFKKTRGIIKTRLRPYLDARNYVIAVLYQKFNFNEESISKIFVLDRSTVNHCKNSAYKFIVELNDYKYKSNVNDLLKLFPFDLKSKKAFEENSTTLTIFNIESNLYTKLVEVSKKKDETPAGYVFKLLLNHLRNL
jgi:hypothetical protein